MTSTAVAVQVFGSAGAGPMITARSPAFKVESAILLPFLGSVSPGGMRRIRVRSVVADGDVIAFVALQGELVRVGVDRGDGTRELRAIGGGRRLCGRGDRGRDGQDRCYGGRRLQFFPSRHLLLLHGRLSFEAGYSPKRAIAQLAQCHHKSVKCV